MTTAIAVLLLSAAATVVGEARGAALQRPAPANDSRVTLEVLQLRPNLYMIAGAGSNIAVQVGEDGVVVVDAGTTSRAPDVVAAIKRLAQTPIRYVIDTSADLDHVGGNEEISKAGQTFLTGRAFGLPSDFGGNAAAILSSERVLTRLSAPAQGPAMSFDALPTETFFYPRKYMYLNDEGIEVLQQPAAHTDGDVFVFFRRSDVIVAGDVLDTTRFPVIDVARGGTVDGEIAALNRLVDMAIPSVPIVSREAGTLVIPGHGRICDQLDVVEYRDMVTIIRDRVRDLIKAGQTLEQVKATNPTRGYTSRYGSASGPWTTDAFVEAVYKSLAAGKS
jgi:glyoxylase-like metal-dependent hydrolase (beta-lactamase superfamily II)